MGKLAEAYVDIVTNEAPLDAGLSSARSKLTGFVGSTKGIFKDLALYDLTKGVVRGIAETGHKLFEAAKAAGDLGESVSKIKATFGTSAGSIIAQSDELASRFGVIKQESLDAASAFGLMGRAAGLSVEASARLGNEFVKLGLDLASFQNLSNQESFDKLRSGLAGESEPLRPLGILLSEDAVKAEALAMGLVRVRRELTQQEKVIARASVIRKAMVNQGSVGDLERTAESSANQLRRLQGEIANAQVEFGEKLLPSLDSGMKLAKEFGATLSEAFGTGPIDTFTGGLKVAIDTMRLLVGATGDTGKGRSELANQATAAGALDKQGNPTGAWKKIAESRAQESPGMLGTAGALAARSLDFLNVSAATVLKPLVDRVEPLRRSAAGSRERIEHTTQALAGTPVMKPGWNSETTGFKPGETLDQRRRREDTERHDREIVAFWRGQKKAMEDALTAQALAAAPPSVRGLKLASDLTKANPFMKGPGMAAGLMGAAPGIERRDLEKQIAELEKGRARPPAFTAQMLGAPEDYAHQAQLAALNKPEDDRRLDEQNKKLDEQIKVLNDQLARLGTVNESVVKGFGNLSQEIKFMPVRPR